MRHWVERSNDTERLPLRQFCQDCIIATRGYDFRKGHVIVAAMAAFGQIVLQNSSLHCESATIESA
jgi:hypothetical protein